MRTKPHVRCAQHTRNDPHFKVSGAASIEGVSSSTRVAGFGFRVSGFGFRVSGFGFRVSGFGFRVSGFWFLVSGFGFRVEGEDHFGDDTLAAARAPDFGFWVWGLGCLGFGVWGLRFGV